MKTNKKYAKAESMELKAMMSDPKKRAMMKRMIAKFEEGGMVDTDPKKDKKAKIEAEKEARKKEVQSQKEAQAAANERKKASNESLAKRTKTSVSMLNDAQSEYQALTPAQRDGAQGAELRAQMKEIRENMRGGSLPGVQVAPTGKLRAGVMTGGTAVEREKIRSRYDR